MELARAVEIGVDFSLVTERRNAELKRLIDNPLDLNEDKIETQQQWSDCSDPNWNSLKTTIRN